jgi:hypothetical protein
MAPAGQAPAAGPANAPKGGGGSSAADEYSDKFEIDPFAGISMYGQVMRGLTTKLVNGGLGGLRLTYNPTLHLGLELWADYDVANVEFRLPSAPGLPTYSFGARNYFFGLNPIFNLAPRGSKVQPYLTVGVNGIQFTPTSQAERIARTPAVNSLYYTGNLNDNLQVGLNYGGGIKFHLSDHFGLRIDARGFWSRNPTYDLPNYPDGGVYIPSRDKINGFQGTVGLVFFAGTSKCPPAPPPPPAAPPVPTPTISGTEGTICQGKPVNLHATLPAPPPGRTYTFAWTINGQPQGGNSPDLTYTPNNQGTFNVQLTVTDVTPPPPPLEKPPKFPVRCWVAPPAPVTPQPATATASFTVTVTPPTISSVTATPNTLMCTAVANGQHTAQLAATAQAGPCGGNLTYKWTVSEGSVTNDTSPNATFDASSLNFEGGAQGQTKTVTATLTVTDEMGQTATQTTTITVNCPPQYKRLDDVIFGKNNARVNNCGKRIMIDDAGSATGDYDIVLVGHRDTDERENLPGTHRRTRGRRHGNPEAGMPLDEARALNAAAVLSAGGATCGHFDPSRIRVDWVGTTQTSEPRPALCGTSNTGANATPAETQNVKERRGQTVTAADKNRRVEVYLVPHGSSAMPPAVQNARPLPDDQMKEIGCPK